MALQTHLPLLIPGPPVSQLRRPRGSRGQKPNPCQSTSRCSLAFLRFACWLPLLLGLRLVLVPASAAAALPEHRLKAIYLFNFTHYIGWPSSPASQASATSGAGTNAPFVIGVAGAPDVEADLRQLATERQAQGRPLLIRSLTKPEDGRGCDIVYVAGQDNRRATEYLKALTETGVLTVGESSDFLSQGGIVRLYRKDDNVRLQIHHPQAVKAGLTIHVRLLSAADVIR